MLYFRKMELKRHARLFLLAGSLVLLAVAIALCLPREPSYAHRPLSYWVSRLFTGAYVYHELENALQHMGTNALPYLFEWSNYKKPSWMIKLEAVYNGLPYALRVRLPYWFNKGELRASGARKALGMLLSVREATVNEIVERVSQPTNQVLMSMIFAAVQRGPQSLPPLMAGLTDQDTEIRKYALDWICLLQNDARPAVPLLIRLLHDHDPSIPWRAAWTLGKLHLEPSLAVPALTNALQSSDTGLRLASAAALGFFGPAARSATPALLQALHDSDTDVRSSATDSLREINAQALTNALLAAKPSS